MDMGCSYISTIFYHYCHILGYTEGSKFRLETNVCLSVCLPLCLSVSPVFIPLILKFIEISLDPDSHTAYKHASLCLKHFLIPHKILVQDLDGDQTVMSVNGIAVLC